MKRTILTVVTLFIAVVTALASGVGLLGHSVTYGNPSYDYDCVPVIDGAEQDTIPTTSSKTYTVSPGSHEFNAVFIKSGGETELGTPKTVEIGQDWEVKCWQFFDD